MVLDKKDAKAATGEAEAKPHEKGEWKHDTAYKRGDRVTRYGVMYRLIGIGALNAAPESNPHVWATVGAATI